MVYFIKITWNNCYKGDNEMGLWCMNCNTGNQNDFDTDKLICKRCQSEKIANVSGKMTVEDIITITSISKDVNFLEAMSALHDTDIIEYESRMSQFRTQVQQQEQQKSSGSTSTQVTCPYCHSTNVKKISGTSKAASVALWGIFSQKVRKNFHCNSCKSEF